MTASAPIGSRYRMRPYRANNIKSRRSEGKQVEGLWCRILYQQIDLPVCPIEIEGWGEQILSKLKNKLQYNNTINLIKRNFTKS